ncbi:hypothetical protein NIES267_43650 [Calothrix parasitica NIES-267]|uniref:Uncharacterized protein n=1 Tax=Calothrix parasitica NIES-267 TaxID=1973488 RepID=A0A1Z4LUD3_9CYAN|nr:hypothetical protein NIES267_43650 [Calothrix parasitica NIES-267]
MQVFTLKQVLCNLYINLSKDFFTRSKGITFSGSIEECLVIAEISNKLC